MKKSLFCLSFIVFIFHAHAQTGQKLYINFTTHNEMANENYDTDSLYFAEKVYFLEKIANTLLAKNVKWNYQTCSKFVLGVLKYQHGATNSADILETLSHSSNISIDPRPKQQPPFYLYNIADVAHLLDSTGVPDSKTVGGFIYFPYNQEDWTAYEMPVTGAVFGNSWQADIIWGGGSIPPHTHDANNFGVWKPAGGADSVSFYSHNPARRLWLVGNGCAYLVDNSADVPAVFSEIKTYATAISNGTLPTNRFYCLSITFNQRDFSETLRAKLGALSDSINTLVDAGSAQWATIQEKRALFQQWSAQNGIPFSQWACGQTAATSLDMPEAQPAGLHAFPNPAADVLHLQWPESAVPARLWIFDLAGRLCWEGLAAEVSLAAFAPGSYRLVAADTRGRVFRRQFIRS